MKKIMTILAGLCLFDASAAQENIASGTYKLDKYHASLSFSVNHLGFSQYTGGFDDFDATLVLDVNDPKKSSVEAIINPLSLDIPSPPTGFIDALLGPDWLNIGEFPNITFKSTRIEMIDEKNAFIYGNFLLHGTEKPLVLTAVLNGGYKEHPMDPNPRVGFSAHGKFNRSDYGISIGIPEPGTTMGVGDEVKVVIEAEFTAQ